jgi:hypothetical protein
MSDQRRAVRRGQHLQGPQREWRTRRAKRGVAGRGGAPTRERCRFALPRRPAVDLEQGLAQYCKAARDCRRRAAELIARHQKRPAARERVDIEDALYRFAAGQDMKDRPLLQSAFARDAVLDFVDPEVLFPPNG